MARIYNLQMEHPFYVRFKIFRLRCRWLTVFLSISVFFIHKKIQILLSALFPYTILLNLNSCAYEYDTHLIISYIGNKKHLLSLLPRWINEEGGSALRKHDHRITVQLQLHNKCC